MNTPPPDRPATADELATHRGILRVATDPQHSAVEVEFDGAVLTHGDVRSLLKEHIARVESSIRRQTFRLEGNACEACAVRLENKVAKLPGIHRASATYIGKVLSVTFDEDVEPADRLADDLRSSGAKIEPLPTRPQAARSFWELLRSGELNEEISCALGFVFLITAWLVGKFSAMPTAALYVAAYVFAGQQGVRSAIASLREKVLDVDVLMVLAALGAAAIGAPFEGALLLFLFSFSNVLQRHAMDRTRRAIESLLTLRPSAALVKRGGEIVSVAVEDLQVGEIVVVRPGTLIPVDGRVAEGSTYADESSLTGESMPVSKSVGSPMFAGTLNQSGGIELEVTKRSEDSALARLVKLVAEAQAEKSQTQRFLETAEQYYAMGVIGFTVLVFLVPYLLHWNDFHDAFFRAMTIMVVASPCALVISTPATVLSAIGDAARRGILIKGGSHLERAARIDIVAVDKTGTLTVGKPSLTGIVTADGVHDLTGPLPAPIVSLLGIAAALEAKSEHPLAQAIVKSAVEHDIVTVEATDFQASVGKGAEATVAGIRHVVGSERMFREFQAEGFSELETASQPFQHEGKTCVWLGRREGERVIAEAVMVMADTIRESARELIADLHRLGVKKIVMLTGDQEPVARAIAAQAKIDEVHAGLLPGDKVNVIRQLKQEGSVMMIGDGVNDAPALAISDLGVAMGAAGTDVAMETADVVLMGDRLENIATLVAHARRAKRVLLQNLIFASAVIVFLIAAALGFALPLPIGVVGHEGSTVLVCLNGLRLLRLRSA